jgi:hypothetical protein
MSAILGDTDGDTIFINLGKKKVQFLEKRNMQSLETE